MPEAASDVEPTSARRSALLLRQTLEWRTVPVNRLLELLGAYVVAAQVRLGGAWLNVVSIHAAPYEWEGSLPPGYQLKPRSCEKHLWHSDIALARLIELPQAGPVLAVGDYNECLGWDEPRHRGHNCGKEFFATLETGCLIDCTVGAWADGERQTGPQRDYQVDRVLADRATARRVHVSVDELEFDKLSDHAPIWFSLDA